MAVFEDHEKKMVLKTWETLFKFHHLAGLLLVALVAAALYLSHEINYLNIVKDQATTKEEQTAHNDSTAHCDFFSGRWIYDNISYPLYKERQCSFVEDDFACEKYGRKDLKYQHWRWQPHHCDLPRFNGTAMLETLRGKKLIFVGDSMNRNQWSSFLCLIESSLPPSSNKSLIKTDNLQFLHEIEYNTTIGFYWSPFLVESNCDDPWHRQKEGHVVRITAIEKHARYWSDADILIFDSYAWWLNSQVKVLWGSFGSSDAIYKTVGTNLRRYEMALSAWSDWLEMNINRTKTKLFFMSASPYTYRDEVSRQCYNISEPIFEEGYLRTINDSMVRMAESTIDKLETRGVKVEYLRITRLSEYRREAHPSIYRVFYFTLTEENIKNPNTYSDCLHWCLPGVPDVWNQILYAHIMKS